MPVQPFVDVQAANGIQLALLRMVWLTALAGSVAIHAQLVSRKKGVS
jgi:hypothetical protein